MDENLVRILDELTVMRAESRETLVTVTRIQEQVRDVGDHEVRLRVLEQELPNNIGVRLGTLEGAVPDNVEVRLTSLERWKYSLPMAGITAVLAAGLSAWTAVKTGA